MDRIDRMGRQGRGAERNWLATLLIGVAVVMAAGGWVAAQEKKALTLDDLYDPVRRVNLNGAPPMGLTWIDATHYLQRRVDPQTRQAVYLRVEARTGKATPLFDSAKMVAAFAKLPGVGQAGAERIARLPLSFEEGYRSVLLNNANDLFYYRLDSDQAIRLTNSAEPEVGEELSPDGKMVSFVRDYNLYVVDLATQRERSLTRDGHERLFNGRLDWVYQEELYGRGNFKGYWWSPDSARIVYLQLDETAVQPFTVVDHLTQQQDLEVYAYPKAGQPNPAVRLGVVDVVGGQTRWVDLFRYQGSEPLIVRVGWKPDSREVVFVISNREQNWIDLNLADPQTGKVRTLFRETSKAWIETDGLRLPDWLRDGTFLWVSERTGWKHIDHHAADGQRIRSITSGRWEARQILGIDEAKSVVYFSGTERSPIGNDAYRIQFDGTGLRRLTQQEGTHQVTLAPDFAHFIDTWSDAWTPTQVHLRAVDGAVVRAIDENRVEALNQYQLSRPEFLQVPTRDQFPMEAMLLKPPNFDPSRKYPVFIHTYAGPHAQQVRNAWTSGMGNLWHQLLAQKGYLVWICDNRSASGKGIESTWTSYRNFGELELRDIEDGVAYLKSLPYVDGARIGINGWSFGGYMTAYALTHSKSFRIGIAGAPVTDWSLYDTIYTERFMGTPQNNPEGYARSSVVAAARNLHGKLLLLHGTIDDNVHLQNTLQLAYALQKAGHPFDLMLYPRSRHGVTDPQLVRHMRARMLDFILSHL
jgi:dipeptidyl-peptidase-4